MWRQQKNLNSIAKTPLRTLDIISKSNKASLRKTQNLTSETSEEILEFLRQNSKFLTFSCRIEVWGERLDILPRDFKVG